MEMINRICHITSVHKFPDTRIFYKECKSLTGKYEVFLIAPNTKDCVLDGVKVCGVDLSSNRLVRVLQLKKVYKRAIDIDADVYHLHDPELIQMGARLKKKGKKVIFDSHEDIPLDVAEKKWIPFLLRYPLSRYYSYLERKVFVEFDALISVTPSIVDKLKLINSNTYQVTNYPPISNFIDERKWKRSLCFAGLLSPNWLHHRIVESLTDIDVVYSIAGRGGDQYIKKLKEGKNGEKVNYVGSLKQSDVRAFIQENSIGMALYDYLPSFGYKLGSLGNNKIFEYMAAGIPIITTDFVLWKEIIDKYQCGICVNPHNIQEISNAIQYLLDNPKKCREMGENGRKAVTEYYNWSSQEKVLFEAYNSIS